MGIAERITKGDPLGDLVLKVYVDRKRPLAKLRNRVPRRVGVPDLGKLPTDVEEIGRVRPELFRGRARPASPGCGLGHASVGVGTFGCLVRKRGDAQSLYILSNSHVLANSGFAKIGDAILQPGTTDGGRAPGAAIATLADFVPFQFAGAGAPNLVDAAIARVARNRVRSAIRLLGFRPNGSSSTVRRNMLAYKVGRTTGYTAGRIHDVDWTTNLRYRIPGVGVRWIEMRDQVLCSRFTSPGDSGAAVLNSSRKMIGLHFAGSDSTSIFNKVSNVLSLLQIRLA